MCRSDIGTGNGKPVKCEEQILCLHYGVISSTHRALQYMRYAGIMFLAGSKEGMADMCHTMKIADKSK